LAKILKAGKEKNKKKSFGHNQEEFLTHAKITHTFLKIQHHKNKAQNN